MKEIQTVELVHATHVTDGMLKKFTAEKARIYLHENGQFVVVDNKWIPMSNVASITFKPTISVPTVPDKLFSKNAK